MLDFISLFMLTFLSAQANFFTENLSVVAAMPKWRTLTVGTILLFSVYIYFRMMKVQTKPSFSYIMMLSLFCMMTSMHFTYHEDHSISSTLHLCLSLASIILIIIAQIIDLYELSFYDIKTVSKLKQMMLFFFFLITLAIFSTGAINSLAELLFASYELVYLHIREKTPITK